MSNNFTSSEVLDEAAEQADININNRVLRNRSIPIPPRITTSREMPSGNHPTGEIIREPTMKNLEKDISEDEGSQGSASPGDGTGHQGFELYQRKATSLPEEQGLGYLLPGGQGIRSAHAPGGRGSLNVSQELLMGGDVSPHP